MKRFWERRSTREKAIFAATAMVVGLSLLWQVVVLPLEGALDALQARVESKEILLAKRARRFANGGGASAAPAASRDEEMSRLIGELGAAAQDSSVRLADVKPQSVAERESLDEYSVEVEAEAPWPSLARFLFELQRSPLLLRVPRFRLSSARGPAGAADMRLSLRVVRDVASARRTATRS